MKTGPRTSPSPRTYIVVLDGDVDPQAVAREHAAAVVVVDHLPKIENGSRYARGSSAKLQIVDVAFLVEAIRPFSRQQDGLLTLTVAKDRRGYLHRRHDVRVLVEDGQMAIEVTPTGAAGEAAGKPALPPAAAKVLEALRDADGPLTNRQIVDRVVARHGHGLKRPTVSAALRDLSQEGLVDEAEPGPRGLKYWTAVPS
jgi:hypothetical protein